MVQQARLEAAWCCSRLSRRRRWSWPGRVLCGGETWPGADDLAGLRRVLLRSRFPEFSAVRRGKKARQGQGPKLAACKDNESTTAPVRWRWYRHTGARGADAKVPSIVVGEEERVCCSLDGLVVL